jgi:hypothetical protein
MKNRPSLFFVIPNGTLPQIVLIFYRHICRSKRIVGSEISVPIGIITTYQRSLFKEDVGVGAHPRPVRDEILVEKESYMRTSPVGTAHKILKSQENR